MEIFGYFAAFLTTISFLPQVILAIRTRDTKSISLAMYAIFVTGVVCWLIYGIVLSSLPLILANSVTLMLSGVVLIMKIRQVIRDGSNANGRPGQPTRTAKPGTA